MSGSRSSMAEDASLGSTLPTPSRSGVGHPAAPRDVPARRRSASPDLRPRLDVLHPGRRHGAVLRHQADEAAHRSPWQSGVAERWVGSVRRELLDDVVVGNERHLRRLFRGYVAHDHDDRTQLGLGKATPAGRPVTRRRDGGAEVGALPRLGGLHHRYNRFAAAQAGSRLESRVTFAPPGPALVGRAGSEFHPARRGDTLDRDRQPAPWKALVPKTLSCSATPTRPSGESRRPGPRRAEGRRRERKQSGSGSSAGELLKSARLPRAPGRRGRGEM